MLISEKVKEKVFHGTNTKEAYLKACKWYATNFISISENKNLSCTFEKVKCKNSMVCSIKLTVYVMFDENEVLQKNCEICNEANKLFYIRGNKNKCDSCKVNPYRERMKERLKRLKEGLNYEKA